MVYSRKNSRKNVYCEPEAIEEYQRLENTAKYQFENTYLYEPCFFNVVTTKELNNEIKMTYLNIDSLWKHNHMDCLKNDINLMSSDIICIAQTKTTYTDDINVDLEHFDIVYCLESRIVTHRQKSMGMIVYRKKSMELFPIDFSESCFYQAIICHLDRGSVCFVCINGHNNSFQESDLTKIMDKICQCSKDYKLLSVIGDFNTKS